MSADDASVPARARDALELVPCWQGREPRIVRSLGGGPSNEAWLVECDAAEFVLRLDTALTDALFLRRDNEAIVAAAVGAAGIGPALVCALPRDGVQVTRHVPGRSWTRKDLARRDNLQRLARVLRRLHALPPVGQPLDLHDAVCRYARQLATTPGRAPAASAPGVASHGAPGADDERGGPSGAAQAAGWANAARALLHGLAPQPAAPCHNDLVAANVIDDGERLTLIDWEYAASGDPLFDLAVVVRHHELDATQCDWLLQAYRGDVRAADRARVQQYGRVYDYLVLLWLSVIAQRHALGAPQRAMLAAATRRVRGQDVD